MSVEIGLKWNGFETNILSKMKELYKDEDIADVTVETDGHIFLAHKFILWANSSVFRTIFQQNPRIDSYYIMLHGINPKALETLITYMYNGEVNVTREFLSVVLKTAEVLKIYGLTEKCFEDLEKSLDSTLENKNTTDISVDDNLDNIYSIERKRTRKSVSKIHFDEIQNKWISETSLKACSNPECAGEEDDNADDDAEDSECCACNAQKTNNETNDSVPSKPKRKRREEKPRAMVRKSADDMQYIKQFPCLYDPNHVNYTNRRIVNQTTEELRALLNEKLDENYSYEATKNLITVYRRFLKRQRKNPDPVETNPDEEYVKQFPCLYDPEHMGYNSRFRVRRSTYQLQAILNTESKYRYSYEDTQELVRSYRQTWTRERLIPATTESPESVQSSPPQSADINEDSISPEKTNPTVGQISNLDTTPLTSAQTSELPIESASYGPELEGNLHVATAPPGIASQANLIVRAVGVNEFNPENTVILSTGFQENTTSDLSLVQIPSSPLLLEQVSELLMGPDSEAEKNELFPSKLSMSQPPPGQTADANITIGLKDMLPDSTGLTGYNVAPESTIQPVPNSPLTLAQIRELLSEPASSDSDVQKDKIQMPTKLPSIQTAEGNIVIGVDELLPEDTALTEYENNDPPDSSIQQATSSPLTLAQITEFLTEPSSCESDDQQTTLPAPTQQPAQIAPADIVFGLKDIISGSAGYEDDSRQSSLQQAPPLTLQQISGFIIESEAQKNPLPLPAHVLAAQAVATEYLPENAELTSYQGSYECLTSLQSETDTSLTLTQLLENLIEPASYESEAQKDTFPMSTQLPPAPGQTAQATITIGLNEFVHEDPGVTEHDEESTQDPSMALTSEQISEFLILTPRADGSAT